jgi:hypothetical protein
VTNGLLTPLEAGFLATRLRRDYVRQQIDAVRRKISELENLAAECEERLEMAESGYDQMHRHAGNAFRARNRKKAKRKVDRRYAYGLEARQARDDLRHYRRQLRIEDRRLDSLCEMASRARIQFVVARHYHMKTLARKTAVNTALCARLAEYIQVAKIPEPYRQTPMEIWYYTETDGSGEVIAVHLFYGGRYSPTGNGCSPDGSGHAHRVLARTPKGLTLVYKREVSPPKHRRMSRSEAIMAATA